MELTREAYWNVSHDVTMLLPIYLLALVAMVLAVYLFVQCVKVYRQRQTLSHNDEPPLRIAIMIKMLLLQNRVLRVRG